MLDAKRLIAEVAARNGIRVDPDDPAFALVTLAQIALEDTCRQLNDQVRANIAEFERSTQKVETRAGKVLAERVNEAAAAFAAELQSSLEEAARKNAAAEAQVEMKHHRSKVYWFAAIGVIAGISLFMVGLWIGIRWNR
jgi:hypothetical protein